MSENRVIGKNNRLPWDLPADHEHFRNITAGKPFIMGRNSYEAPDRFISDKKTIILSTGKVDDLCANCLVENDLSKAIDRVSGEEEIFILGGQQVFEQSFPLANYIYLTIIHAYFEGDAFFPEFDHMQWKIQKKDFHHKDKDNPYDYTFLEYSRI